LVKDVAVGMAVSQIGARNAASSSIVTTPETDVGTAAAPDAIVLMVGSVGEAGSEIADLTTMSFVVRGGSAIDDSAMTTSDGEGNFVVTGMIEDTTTIGMEDRDLILAAS
jgi:hypothetical protein